MNKKILSIALIATVVLSLMSACGSNSSSSASGNAKSASYDDSYAAAESAYAADYAPDVYDDYEYEESGTTDSVEDVEVTDPASNGRKLIRTVYLDVETYDFDDLTAAINVKVTGLGGYIESSSVDGNISSSNRYASYTLRVPRLQADNLITSISDKGNVTHRSENMEDVTLQYVDINSRKESLQTEYKRLEELIKEADDIEELIYIESRMSDVRYEIESIESQLRTYDNLVDYTTIHLNIQEVKVYTEPEPEDDSIGARIKRGYTEAFENITEFLSDLLVFILVALPYLIVIALIIGLIILICVAIGKIFRKIHPKKAHRTGVRYPAGYQQNIPPAGVTPQPQQMSATGSNETGVTGQTADSAQTDGTKTDE